MLARNSDLCWLATSSWALLSSMVWKSRAFAIATAAWEANVCRSAAVPGGICRPLGLLSPANTPTVWPRAIIGITRKRFVRSALRRDCGFR